MSVRLRACYTVAGYLLLFMINVYIVGGSVVWRYVVYIVHEFEQIDETWRELFTYRHTKNILNMPIET